MNAIIISIGEELTSGQTVDTNSAFLARRLAECGIKTLEHHTVSDDRGPITAAIARAAQAAELVIVTGGLGPTDDDLTRHGLADALGTELAIDPKCLAHLEEWFRSRGRTMVASNRVQAMVPRGAEPLDNRMGTAPGLAAKVGGATVYVTPGVPSEMKMMFEEVIRPRLPAGTGVIASKVVHTFGSGESDVGMKIADLMRRGANPLVGTTVAAGMVSIRIQAHSADPDQARAMAAEAAAEVRRRLGDLVVGEDDETMAAVVGGLLRKRGQTLATAESCTGGLIGELITSVSGSSEYYLGGVVAYANRVKVELLGVSDELLRQAGAVSEPVAGAMTEGCRRRFSSDWAISVTGVAGPTGGTAEKPVGLVYIGLSGPGGTEILRSQFSGTREVIRLRASLMGMNLLRLKLLPD
jgi:nicotinamide-nucleotide amidase